MTRKARQFSEDATRRIKRAVRDVESIARRTPESPYPPAAGRGMPTHVVIEEEALEETTEYDEIELNGNVAKSEIGLYPAKVVFPDLTSDEPGWWEDEECFVLSLNGRKLTVGDVYHGTVTGDRNGKAVITVDFGTAADVASLGCDETGWGWVAGMLAEECFYLTVTESSGYCSGISTTQAVFMRFVTDKWVSQEWDTVTEAWIDKNFVTNTDSSPIHFKITDGRPRLIISGIPYDLVLSCGGSRDEKVIVFQGGGATPCDGTIPAEDCQDNTFTVKLVCTCCPINGWQGDGWYGIVGEGEDCTVDDCTAVLLTMEDGDHCRDDIIICDKYVDQAAAETACPPTPIPVSAPCQSRNFATATAEVSNVTGDCADAGGCPYLPGILDGPTGTGTDAASWSLRCEGGPGVGISCVGGQYQVSSGTAIGTIVSFTAGPPLVIVADLSTVTNEFCHQTGATGTAGFRVTITLP